MAGRYNSPLSGEQVTNALELINARTPERWAVGSVDGQPVPATDETYHNNSKYYAQYAHEQAEIAKSSIPVGTAGALFYDRALSLTPEQKEQGQRNLGVVPSNRNLLDNPWFTVAQAGYVANHGNKLYAADRWGVEGNTDVTVSNGIVNLKNNSILFQRSETRELNKTYTMSVLLADGSIVSGTKYVTGSTTFINESRFTCSMYDSPTVHNISIQTKTDVSIKAVKLEPGSVSTLANDVAPNYAEELAKCQRYFQRINFDDNVGLLALSTNANTVKFSIPLITEMRVSQNSVIYLGGINISNCRVRGHGLNVSALTSISGSSVLKNYAVLTLSKNDSFAPYNMYGAFIYGNVDISCDL